VLAKNHVGIGRHWPRCGRHQRHNQSVVAKNVVTLPPTFKNTATIDHFTDKGWIGSDVSVAVWALPLVVRESLLLFTSLISWFAIPKLSGMPLLAESVPAEINALITDYQLLITRHSRLAFVTQFNKWTKLIYSLIVS